MAHWSGSLCISDEQEIAGLRLSPSHETGPSLAIAPGPLNFLAFVATCKIPLHLAAGPSLQVETSSEDATSWFSQVLLHEQTEDGSILPQPDSGATWFESGQPQSNIGILTRAQYASRYDATKDEPRITEVLFYATKSSTYGDMRLPTPPASSPSHSPSANYAGSSQQKDDQETSDNIVLCALPLSSDLIYQPSLYEDGDSLSQAGGQAHFLPNAKQLQQQSQLTRKRDQLEDLFEGAPDRRRKAKRLRMESLSQADERAEFPQRAAFGGALIKAPAKEDSAPVEGALEHQSRQRADSISRTARSLSRSPSLSSTRPASSKGPPMVKRSTLSQLTTSETFEDNSHEARNKAAVSRIVMAGMRMFGLQQQRKRSIRPSSIGSAQELLRTQSRKNERDHEQNEDEFKQVYHQTYKGTLFAFRHKLSEEMLSPESIRDVVDKLLLVFCNEPP